MALPPLPDIFGNYAVAKLEHLVEPNPVSLWPSAPGWKVVLVLALLWLGYRGFRQWQRWRRNRYRREALAVLQQCRDLPAEELVPALARLLKSTALAAFPRTEVAALSGPGWLDWLEQQGGGFSADSRGLLAEAQYRPPVPAEAAILDRLLNETEAWVRTHPEPA